MFWRRSKGAETRIRLKALERAVTTQSSDPELRLAEALREYESSYYAKVSRARDENAEQAKLIVKQARTFISESRLAYAICRLILNHVMHWPLSRPDFDKYASGPFRYLDGECTSGESAKTIVVKFLYFSNTYTLRFLDEGISMLSSMSDMHSVGKLELIADEIVLGLDISRDMGIEFSNWSMSDVYAFLPGPWMKDVIEMAAYIDGSKSKEREARLNEDALSRAKANQASMEASRLEGQSSYFSRMSASRELQRHERGIAKLANDEIGTICCRQLPRGARAFAGEKLQ